LLEYHHTPVQEIRNEVLDTAGVRLLIKREDLNHPTISGNKWWKLKYNLVEAMRRGEKALLTFGGAYSNHIYAVASVAKELGFKSIGVIRGDETLPLNATLSFVATCGMKLHFVSRENYRRKSDPKFTDELHKAFGDFYLIPEGGTNTLAIKGCAEFARSILSDISFDYLCLPVGTGGTMAGLVAGLQGKKEIIGFSALKGGSFLESEIRYLLKDFGTEDGNHWRVETEYHFGGYGKFKPELDDFISSQWMTHELPLDPVYTAKALYGVFDLIRLNKFRRGSSILFLHTGGLQGRKSQ
jgi:1-aminocyclopropane-1-carboxylate deaminase